MIAGFEEIAPFVLAVVISFLAMIQKSDDRLVAGALFAVVSMGHIVLFYAWKLAFSDVMDGITYFVTASVAKNHRQNSLSMNLAGTGSPP